MPDIDIFFTAEHVPQFSSIEAEPTHRIELIRIEILRQHGGDEALIVFLEDVDEPVDASITIEELAKKGPVKLHLHRCRHVEVSVSFGPKTVSKRFGPGTTIARIKRWAAEHEFHMTPGDAAEHLLQIKGTTDRPSASAHVGTLVKCPHCAIAFDLIPQMRVQG